MLSLYKFSLVILFQNISHKTSFRITHKLYILLVNRGYVNKYIILTPFSLFPGGPFTPKLQRFIKKFSPQAYKNPYFLLTLPPGEKNMEFPENTKIDSHTITIVPGYCETDQAGVVHHTVYPVWFEMGRTELLRANGLAYSKLEKAGICFVVTRLNIKYHSPALYDEKLELTTTCTNISTARVEHSYCLKRQTTGLLLAEADSTLACQGLCSAALCLPGNTGPKKASIWITYRIAKIAIAASTSNNTKPRRYQPPDDTLLGPIKTISLPCKHNSIAIGYYSQYGAVM